ncbi:MAG: DNA cytosine methyltransferase, partial [Actinomycetota bacterium]|nr:DNA cytosine methyltransferase [Actinomycetota bacterium]
MATLSETETRVIETHRAYAGAGSCFVDGQRVRQWDNATSVYFSETGRLWVHNDTARRQARQDLYFHSVDSVCGTLTCSHALKFWDLGRIATPRELLRVQGFPENFVCPPTRVQRLVGNAVAVPCATHACRCVVSEGEVVRH